MSRFEIIPSSAAGDSGSWLLLLTPFEPTAQPLPAESDLAANDLFQEEIRGLLELTAEVSAAQEQARVLNGPLGRVFGVRTAVI